MAPDQRIGGSGSGSLGLAFAVLAAGLRAPARRHGSGLDRAGSGALLPQSAPPMPTPKSVPPLMSSLPSPPPQPPPSRVGGALRARTQGPQPGGGGRTTVLLLGAVPALWGSYGVAVKLLFRAAPGAPLPAVNAATYLVAAVTLALARQRFDAPTRGAGSRDFNHGGGVGLVHGARTEAADIDQQQELRQHGHHHPRYYYRRVRNALGSRLGMLAPAAELGVYLFVGSLAQLVALQHTSASRSAFLVQLTTVLVPTLDVALLGAAPDLRVFLSATLALLGVVVLSRTGPTVVDPALGDALGAFNVGDALSLLAAAAYTTHVLRLEKIVLKVPSILALVEGKAVVQFCLSVLAASFTLSPDDRHALTTASSLQNIAPGAVATTLGCLVWIGAMSTAAATVCQVEGQKRVGASVAAVIYAAQPAFAVLFAYVVLGERLTPGEFAGGFLVVVSGLGLALSRLRD
jgi:drug/metabolite transporter (DMT)-like permease